jgi:methionine-rich copper-binding protein CopC
MKKIIFVLMLLMLIPTTALAHTGLESSTPKDKETITNSVKEIALTFNTNLEKLSTFSLLDKQGQKVNVDNLSVEGKILKGTFNNPLTNGDYTVNWKIVGEDGHVIERSFTFAVNMPEQVKEASTLTPTPSEPVKESSKEQTPIQTASVLTPSNDKNIFVWIGVGVLVLIGLVGFTMRKRN